MRRGCRSESLRPSNPLNSPQSSHSRTLSFRHLLRLEYHNTQKPDRPLGGSLWEHRTFGVEALRHRLCEVALGEDQLEEVKGYLKEQEVYTILYFNESPIAVNPPLFIELVVKETMPGVRGDTAQGAGTKPATLETGLVVQVPLFVEEGDVIKIDTRKKEYIERV